MKKSLTDKYHDFERTVFLKSRHMKTAGALAAVGTLTTLLNELGQEEIVASNQAASESYVTVSTSLANISGALNSGAQDIAISLYAQLISSLPEIHTAIAHAVPAGVRGGDPTDAAALANAAERALVILGA